MTKWDDVQHDPKYIKVLDHGFVGLVDHMGSDNAIVQAARVSYGNGTKSVREDRGLIRYLMRHKHTSPFEMCEIKLHIKLPIFIMRQLVRHRTASLNEYSGRYSVMTDEFYIPEVDQIKPQSKDNKQGRAGELNTTDALKIQAALKESSETNYALYNTLIAEGHNPEDFHGDFDGIAREIARTALPVSNYTELYWKQNLKNMFHLLRLRLHPHAQYEIRVLAQAIYDIIKPLFPECCQAFEDYELNAVELSSMDKAFVQYLMNANSSPKETYLYLLDTYGDNKGIATYFGMTERELRVFLDTWNLA